MLELVRVTSLDIAAYLFSVRHFVVVVRKIMDKGKYNPNDASMTL